MTGDRRPGQPARATGGRSAQKPSQRSRRADPSRQAAYETVRAVALKDAYANLVLPGLLRERRITGRDAAFATELAYGTLRMQGLYDAVLTRCVDRPLAELDDGVLDALRIGAHQLLSMRVPPHAAVGETVALVRANLGGGPAGLTNAVLRKVGEHETAAWVDDLAGDSTPLDRMAVEHSHPLWIVRALREALAGRGVPAESLDTELEALLAADNDAAKVTLVARPGLAGRDELVVAGGEPSTVSPYAVTWPGGDPSELAAVREGRAGVQDEGSQLMAVA
ncbi:MAG TPA: transcription antitermination factor NusB, partial [Actinomycetales bacterium]